MLTSISAIAAQNLSGTGTVTFTGTNGYGYVNIEDGVNAVIGSGMTIHGDYGVIGDHDYTNNTVGNSLTNNGLISSDSGYAIYVRPNTFTNNSTVQASNNSTLYVNPTNFTNSGTVKATGGGTINVGLAFTNTGTVQSDTGSTINVSADLTQTAGTTLVNGLLDLNSGKNTLQLNGGTLAGTGTVQGTVNNASTVIVGNQSGTSLGTLDIKGNYTQSAGDILSIDLGGTKQGQTYDLLAVLDKVSLAGEMDVKLVDGFKPTQGETFNFLTYNSRIGQFDEVLPFDNGYMYTVNYNDTLGMAQLVVSAVPETSTLVTAGILLTVGELLLRRRQNQQKAA